VSATGGAGARTTLPLRVLERIGAPPRRGAQVALAAAAVALGVLVECTHRATWRRTVRAEFRRALRQALLGGLLTVVVTASIIGLGIVYQAIAWLSFIGQEGLAGQLLVIVIVREVAPVLVGLILLGRSGTVAVVELGAIKAAGQLRMLESQGLDPFTLLVLPRVIALAVAGFTMGVVFLGVAFGTGWLAAEMLGLLRDRSTGYVSNIIEATARRDFVLFAAKLSLAGALVGLTAAVTGLSATRRDTPSFLLPRAFVRGLLAVLLCSALLSLAFT
jgi:phospholipid/cholesterol/gamma-HCH transport system permease protein